jgi:AraC-like DNA-binding protein
MEAPTDLTTIVESSSYVEDLLDGVPDVVFFVKDPEGRYRVVNSTLVERCGLCTKAEIVGRTAEEVFPPPLGRRYLEQDRQVLRSGLPIRQKLELHLYPNRFEGWCLTDKIALVRGAGAICGLAGISRDLRSPSPAAQAPDELAQAMEIIRDEATECPAVVEIARRVGLSGYQLNARIKDLLGITTRQLLTKTRIETASRILRTTTLPIGEVAQRSGYFDQSAFTRQFRHSTGLTPKQYRARHQGAYVVNRESGVRSRESGVGSA